MGTPTGAKASLPFSQARRRIMFKTALQWFLGVILVYYAAVGFLYTSSMGRGCMATFGAYHGHEYQGPETLSSKCLIESKWMKVQQHTTTSGIPDWLWVDYHDRINVLVEAASASKEFLIIQQTKYALEGRTSLAIVGGIIEPSERPEDAARREVKEELGQECQEWKFLGRYRTDVNRGMGWVNSFVALNCQVSFKHDSALTEKDEVGIADTERQDVVRMSLAEVAAGYENGEFVEVQWSNTVGLALQYLKNS